MQEKKSFWKKFKLVFIAIITLLFIFLLVFLNQKINFLLGNDLTVLLVPQQISLNMHYGDVRSAKFDISVENPAYCKARCSYTFNDRSSNEVIDKGNFEIENAQHIAKDYNLKVKRLGSGQDLYSFDVKCRSLRSLFCITKSPEKIKSSLVIVNYDLSETEKELKKILKQNVTDLLRILNEVDILHQQLNQKYFELAHSVNLNSIAGDKIAIDDAYDKTRVSIENLKSMWAVENYIKLNKLFNASYSDSLIKIKNSIAHLGNDIGGIVELHNSLLAQLDVLSDRLNELNIFVNFIGNNQTAGDFDKTISKFSELASLIINNTFPSYSDVTAGLGDILKQEKNLENSTRSPAAELFVKSEYYLDYENNLLCTLQNNCAENISVTKTLENTDKFMELYPAAEHLLQNCNALNNLNGKYSGIRNETLTLLAGKNVTVSDRDFLSSAAAFKDNILRKINNSYFGSFEKTRLLKKTSLDIVNLFLPLLPKNITDAVDINHNQSINFSLYLLSQINLSENSVEVLEQCPKLGIPANKLIHLNFEPVSQNVTYKIAQKIDANLSDNPPICCIFKDCKPCCRDDSCKNDPKTFPIIFLHGHSVASAYSPEFSLDAFNNLQYKLQDDGYLNAGTLLYSGESLSEKGVWGLSGKPITVKATYYYDVYRKEEQYVIVPAKSESIDTYALRLNDIINVVKEKTGKPKVNIVAFSMGGLVARKYIQIFGDNSVDKLITLGTPHKGISGTVAGLCPVLGESKECADMQENSLFLNKLNNPSLQPSSVKIYTIIGQGCQRDGKDGDGIVTAEQASLKGIVPATEFYVNGTCPSFSQFHVDLLDTGKHPGVYRIISGILQG